MGAADSRMSARSLRQTASPHLVAQPPASLGHEIEELSLIDARTILARRMPLHGSEGAHLRREATGASTSLSASSAAGGLENAGMYIYE